MIVEKTASGAAGGPSPNLRRATPVARAIDSAVRAVGRIVVWQSTRPPR